MDYITLSQAQTLLGRLLDVYRDEQNVMNDSHLTLVIDEAEGMVNSAIGSRYSFPVTETAAVSFLRSIVVPIIRYKTFTQFTDTDDIPTGIQLEYKAAMETLDKLAKQIISLPGVTEKTTGRASHIKITTNTSTTGF